MTSLPTAKCSVWKSRDPHVEHCIGVSMIEGDTECKVTAFNLTLPAAEELLELLSAAITATKEGRTAVVTSIKP